MSKKQYVIIGGSAAGPKAASKIRRLDGEAEITIIQKGQFLSMASCGYPYYVGGVFDDRNLLIATPTGTTRDPSFFSAVKGIEALVDTEVTEIQRDRKLLVAVDLGMHEKRVIPYDKLVIATGARPIFPDLPGRELGGITTLQSMEDAEFLKQAADGSRVRKAVIIGGGLIGIETCEALQLAGIQVTLVEMREQILPFLDWEMAKKVEGHLDEKGAQVKTGVAASGFVGEGGQVTGVLLSSGETVHCDLVVVAIGTRPNSELAAQAGLETGKSGGITVNRFMQTSDKDIYAACYLRSLGYRNVKVMEGGLAAWPYGLRE